MIEHEEEWSIHTGLEFSGYGCRMLAHLAMEVDLYFRWMSCKKSTPRGKWPSWRGGVSGLDQETGKTTRNSIDMSATNDYTCIPRITTVDGHPPQVRTCAAMDRRDVDI